MTSPMTLFDHTLKLLFAGLLIGLASTASARSEIVVKTDTPDGAIVAGTVGQNFVSCKSALGIDEAFVLDETDGSLWIVDHAEGTRASISDRSLHEWGDQREAVANKQKQLKPGFDSDSHISTKFKKFFDQYYGKPVKPPPGSDVTWPTIPSSSAQPVTELENLSKLLHARRVFIRSSFPLDPRMADAFSCYFAPSPVPFTVQPTNPQQPALTFTARIEPAPHAKWRQYQLASLWEIFAQYEPEAMFMGESQ